MSTQRWQENTTGYETVDAENGIIRGVKILGLKSKNKRRYLAEAVGSAASLYEGAKVYIDHSDPGGPKTRGIRERWGKLENVVARDGELYGDLAYLRTHKLTESILEAIERFGDFGLSHDASGVVKNERGERVVTKIEQVFSVDVVTNPATNSNLFEGVEVMTKQKLTAVLRENIKEKAASELLARLVEIEGFDANAVEFDVDEGADAVALCLRESALAIMDSDASIDKKLDQLRQVVGVKPEVVRDLPEETELIKSLKAQVDQLTEAANRSKVDAACRELLESHKREVTDVRLQAMAGLPEESRKLLVESWPEKVTRPATSPGRITEGVGQSKDLPKDFDSFRSAIL